VTDLEQRLAALSQLIDWPRADVTARVRSNLAVPQPHPRRWLRVATVTALVIIALAVATPWGRQAVADLFGVAGITLRWGSANQLGSSLDLGEQIALEQAAARVTFPLLVPTDEPASVYHDEVPATGIIHMVWPSGEALPSAGDSDVGLLYSQFTVEATEMFIKTVGATSEVSEVTVRGNRGFWIEGAEHFVVYWDDSAPVEETGRLAANVLAWVENGVTHRIETTGDLQTTLDVAESLRPTD
jgi:hypothetical protein